MDRTATSAIPDARCGLAPAPFAPLFLFGALLGALVLPGCEGSTGPAGPAGPSGPSEPTPTEVAPGRAAPEIHVVVEELTSTGGGGGAFAVGDRVAVRFRLEQEDGTPWALDEMVSGEALVSGPSFNYQRVLPLETDVLTAATDMGDGSYVYTFADPLPAVYAPPYNDSPDFDLDHGELAGTPLLEGTYTVGLSFAWDFTVEGQAFQQVGETTADFLLGNGGGPLTPRDVVGRDNCNQCHTDLRAHGGRYRELVMCLLCHTAGAEDRNDPSLAGGTPGITIDSRVLFHKLHTGRGLPSVLGMATRNNGTRNYDATPRPYVLATAEGELRDFSHVGWPGMPVRVAPMPRDVGYGNLAPSRRAQEDAFRSGPTNCDACHGDPDGAGPLEAPSQGDLRYNQPSRKACGSCHDDVDFEKPYRANFQTMPEQPDDSQCIFCHDPNFTSALSPIDAHVHPQYTFNFNDGLHVEVTGVREAGTHDGDGTLDPGEKIRLRFTVRDDDGLEVDASTLDEVQVLVAGPTSNLQHVLDVRIPTGLLGGSQPYAGKLPQVRLLEHVGTATAALGDVFTTAFTPHLSGPGVDTTVRARTATFAEASVLAAGARAGQNFLDVADTSAFARDDHVVVDDGVPGLEEYLRIQFVDGNRLWLSSPATRDYKVATDFAHGAGATVERVDLTVLTEGVDYALEPSTGTLTELLELGAGTAVVVDYTTDFVVPDVYPVAHNGSPDLDDRSGEWTGKDLVDGTYLVGIAARVARDWIAFGVPTTYQLASETAVVPFLVGSAASVEPYDLVSSGENCNACHADLAYHGGGDRGFEGCILCHGSPGAEDRPRYVSANAPETSGRSVGFHNLLHKIHRGRELEDTGFRVVGEGDAPYPDDFREHSYSEFGFPPIPGGTSQCARCHGEGNEAALFPGDHAHPDQQVEPVRAWSAACGACHDSASARAHIELETSPSGLEACAVCHGSGDDQDVVRVHETR